MDNLENYLYIALALIYIISRVLKARSKQQQAPKSTRPQQHAQTTNPINRPQPRKAFSFEDILKEFEKNLAGEEFEEEKTLPVEEIPYERTTRMEPPKEKESPSPYQTYEGISYESPIISEPKKELEVFTRNEKYSIKKDLASQYVKMLQDPEGFKNAIVLSEIINRKYF